MTSPVDDRRSSAGDDMSAILLIAIFRLENADLHVFERYEAAVLPLLSAHGGVLERRIRGADENIELHLLRFLDRAAFARYRNDDRRTQLAALFEQSGVTVELHEGFDWSSPVASSAAETPIPPLDPKTTALIVVDVQMGFDDPKWGRRNNPGAEARIADLLSIWRDHAAPVFHAQHASTEPDSPLRPWAPGHAIKSEASPTESEPVYVKTVNSAFIGTSLEKDLRAAGIETVAIAGLTTNHCVSTTARMAANLGFTTLVVSDATATFDRQCVGGRLRPADEVHDAALSDLSGEFAMIAETVELASALAAGSAKRTRNSVKSREPLA